jgi:hypothetical protein
MTVAQLIAELQKYPPDALAGYETDAGAMGVTHVTFEPPDSPYSCATTFDGATCKWSHQTGNFVYVR